MLRAVMRTAPMFRARGFSVICPDFDTAETHARGKAARRKACGEDAEMGVYLGGKCAQSRFRIGLGGFIFRYFNRLPASGVGSVTCQTCPLGLDNCAS